MEQFDISMFRSPEGLLEAEHMIFAASVMLRQAMGEVTACNSLTGKEVFKGKRAERIIPAFDAVFKIMGDAQKAFKATREELLKQLQHE